MNSSGNSKEKKLQMREYSKKHYFYLPGSANVLGENFIEKKSKYL